jgi:hypothetical protein
MKNKKPNAESVWKQLEDQLVPRLRLSVIDRVVYTHLLRHSHLEGKRRLRFSIPWLARGARLCGETVRRAVHRLVGHGALRLLERSKFGHVVEVYLPGEIRAARGPARLWLSPAASPTDTDFLRVPALRQAIHARERGQCFYCLRPTTPLVQCLDHVVPRAKSGSNSYHNLVSSCLECNTKKGEKPAEDFLVRLYRERRLTTGELAARLRALDDLAAGKLRPAVLQTPNLFPLKRRPRR